MRKAKFQKQLTIAIPPEHYAQIKKITDAEDTSMGEWVRQAVEKELTANQPKETAENDK